MRRPSKEQINRISTKKINKAIDRNVQKIVSEMPIDEQTTIALGFYEMDGIYADAIAEKMEDFINFNDYSESDTSDSTTSVNGEFGTNGTYDGLDNFQDTNEYEFDEDEINFSKY